MNMNQKVRAFLLAARIEYHWWWILRGRKQGKAWIDHGETLNSPRMIRLNSHLNHHGRIAKQFEKYYAEHYLQNLPIFRTENVLSH